MKRLPKPFEDDVLNIYGIIWKDDSVYARYVFIDRECECSEKMRNLI